MNNKPTNQYGYDDGDIPPIDLPRDNDSEEESAEPRKDRQGGE